MDNNANCPVMDIMCCVDANKEQLGDGVYMELCNIILRIKKHHELLTKDVRRLKKKMFQSLKYKIHPYPKGENKRYDASYKPITQGKLF